MTKLPAILKLTLVAVALPLLGGCAAARSHIGPSIEIESDTPVDVVEAPVAEGGECDPAIEGVCSVPVTPTTVDPNAPCVPEGGNPCLEGGEPVPPTTGAPVPCVPGEGGVTC